jgi:hypothetical protein
MLSIPFNPIDTNPSPTLPLRLPLDTLVLSIGIHAIPVAITCFALALVSLTLLTLFDATY